MFLEEINIMRKGGNVIKLNKYSNLKFIHWNLSPIKYIITLTPFKVIMKQVQDSSKRISEKKLIHTFKYQANIIPTYILISIKSIRRTC